jgi:hypothetical protein
MMWLNGLVERWSWLRSVFIVHGIRNGGYLCRQNRIKTPRLAAGCSLNSGFGEGKDHGDPLGILGPSGILLHVLFQ